MPHLIIDRMVPRQVAHVLTLIVALAVGMATAADSGQGTYAVQGNAQAVTDPPVVTSPTTASGSVGVAFSYQITASQEPASFAASGLPSGLTVDGASGLISGTPLVAGTSTLSISAANDMGTGDGTLTITIVGAGGPPVISGPTSASATVGIPFSYQISASNTPFTYSAAGLPSGLVLSVTTGEISGAPFLAGTSVVSLGATNIQGTGTETLTITVAEVSTPGTQPQITSPLNVGGTVGSSFSYTIQATNAPTAFAASGLPSGLSVNTSTGVISGTPVAAATTDVIISAANAEGTDSETVRLVVSTGGGSGPPGSPGRDNDSGCGAGSGLSALLLAAFIALQATFRPRRRQL
jgi:hypothetical protein